MSVTAVCEEKKVLMLTNAHFLSLVVRTTFLLLFSLSLVPPLFAEEANTSAPGINDSPNEKSKDVLSAVSQGDWFIVETLNFRISSRLNGTESVECARRCETLRQQLKAKWLPESPAHPWTPKAEIVVHRNVEEFLATIGRNGSGASGSVTVKQKNGQVVQRRIDLRADVPGWNTESLAHELTHLIVADRFGGRTLPRWADEGMAVLSESRAKQLVREKAGTTTSIPLGQLLCTDVYPMESQRATFYAQSAALTDYLVNRGSREQFLTFIERAMNQGYDRALIQTYSINGVCELDRQWKSKMPPSTPAISTLARR